MRNIILLLAFAAASCTNKIPNRAVLHGETGWYTVRIAPNLQGKVKEGTRLTAYKTRAMQEYLCNGMSDLQKPDSIDGMDVVTGEVTSLYHKN